VVKTVEINKGMSKGVLYHQLSFNMHIKCTETGFLTIFQFFPHEFHSFSSPYLFIHLLILLLPMLPSSGVKAGQQGENGKKTFSFLC
jgi:hypothetical protein